MVHLLSVGFLSPFGSQFQGTEARRFACGRQLVNRRPVKEQMLREYPERGTIGLSMSCWRIDNRERANSRVAISLRGRILISGFWTGPDADDGWGYVEAYICQEYS